MPRQVDHDERRRELLAAATALVVARGRSSLTVRSVADAVGCSTKVVSHYFVDMADLLFATYTAAAARASARLELVMANDPNDIQGYIEAVLPLDADRRCDWAIWFAFWSEALSSEAYGAEQRARARNTTNRLAAMLRRLASDGRLPSDVDVAIAARRLGALIPGIAGQAMFDPATWTPTRQREVVSDELRRLGL